MVGPTRWGPKGGARRVGPEGCVGGAQNFALFFLLPPPFSFFLCLSGGLLVEFWWCLKCRGAQMCTFGVLWLSCGSPGGPGRAVQGKGGPGEEQSREGRSHKGRPKPNLETNTHETPLCHTDNTQHITTQHNTQQIKIVLAKVGFGQSWFWPKSAKSVLAKVGHDRDSHILCLLPVLSCCPLVPRDVRVLTSRAFF